MASGPISALMAPLGDTHSVDTYRNLQAVRQSVNYAIRTLPDFG
jgi:hypothetical protein